MSKHDGKYADALRQLGGWFERQRRILPWRDDPSPYRVWISEIMLQQTQVITVLPYFQRFLARFPEVESLAGAPLDDVLLHWAGLGYYSRARNIHRAAQGVVARGGFPRDREGWLELPGIGPYTAGAILSIAYNEAEAILDGNVERVLSRVRRVSRQNGDARYKARLWRLARAFVRDGKREGVEPRDLNQALMELGAMVCVPRAPRCGICPLSRLCRAHGAGEELDYPPKKAPKAWIAIEEKAFCLLREAGSSHEVWLRRLPEGQWRGGLWDLPEAPMALNPSWKRIGEIETRHVVTRHKIRRVTEVWRAPVDQRMLWRAAEEVLRVGGSVCDRPTDGLAVVVNSHDEGRWVAIGSTADIALGSAAKKTLGRIAERFL